MPNKWLDRLIPGRRQVNGKVLDMPLYLRNIVTGSMYKISDIRGSGGFSDIKTQIDTMRALARDSQISIALSYYATDATTVNTAGQIIWATPVDDNSKDVAEVVNELFKRWNINSYARDHILELATIGNLYIPTTYLYRDTPESGTEMKVVLDNNTIPDNDFDIVPSYKIPPETIVHLWYHGKPRGYIMDPDDNNYRDAMILPESGCIHFSLGGLLGDYTLAARDPDGNDIEYDIQFASPLMASAVQPTQTLGLLEDAIILSSLIRTIKFLIIECGSQETEIKDALQQVKDAIEQQLALNTATGDAQSFVNPQSPNNLIYMPKINGQDPISIVDLNMAEATDADNKLLEYYQDKKLSVLGVPKEVMNFSSNEGLGGAGSVLSQRSAIYANSLQRLETAYMEGWRSAINQYFIQRNMTGFVDKYQLHMNPIITTQSTIQFEKRDSALSQAGSVVDLLKNLGVTKDEPYHQALVEILSEVFPQMGTDATTWDIDVTNSDGGNNAF